LAWRNSWDTGGLTAKVDAAVTENDRDARIQMYKDIQAEFRETSPFVVMFQQIEQSALRDNVMNWSTGQAVTSAAYWQVTK
jgi:peptide/nickel transport system substrate-binding protein